MLNFKKVRNFIHTAHFHLLMMGLWGTLLVPTILLWRESIAWVVFMSWYANFVGHWGSYQAARTEEKQDKVWALLDSMSGLMYYQLSPNGHLSLYR